MMTEYTTDVMMRSIADRQERLRAQRPVHFASRSVAPSRVRRLTGDMLIRLGERLRGELGELRETGATPARAEVATP